MKVATKLLVAALAFPSAIAKKKSFLPISSMLRLEAVKNKLSIRAADGDQFAEQVIECEGELAATCVSVYGLNTLTQFFKDEAKFEVEKGALKIEAGGRKPFTLPISEATDFPTLPEKDFKLTGISPEELAIAVTQVQFAAHESPAVSERYGVHVKSEAKRLVAEATNGLRYARCEKLIISADADVFLPLQFLDSLVLALKSKKAKLKLSDKMIAVSFEGGSYACKLGVLNFPNAAAFFAGDQEELGEIEIGKWMPMFKGAVELNGAIDATCKVIIEGDSFEHVSKNGALSLKLPEKLKEVAMNLNGSTFLACIAAFGDAKAKLFLNQNKAVIMKSGDLSVITSQLRES